MVRLKEQEASFDVNSLASFPEITSFPPKFDLTTAQRAKSLVDGEGFSSYPALNLALSLAVYNYAMYTGVTEDQMRTFTLRFINLTSQEVAASDPRNPLTTIGFEVESPKKLFNREQDSMSYAQLFDAIGMPRNKVNDVAYVNRENTSSWPIFWEFSPPPSYTASVQTRILCELIKGRFIPSLRRSKDPDDIRQFLDDKLVSLHINLGVPTSQVGEDWRTRYTEDLKLFSTMFPLAFTSSHRLLYRNQSVFYSCKSADQTSKNGGNNSRLELKALEVRDSGTYRMIKEIQLLGSAMLRAFMDKKDPFGIVWEDSKAEVRRIYQRYNVEPDVINTKQAISNLVVGSDIGLQLRRVITYRVLEVTHFLSKV